MPLYLTQSRSARITKPVAGPTSLRRTVSSPLANSARVKLKDRQHSVARAIEQELSDDEDTIDELLLNAGKVIPTYNIAAARDVVTAMNHATTSMFGPIPDRAGMNSTRIAEVLNFHKGLPPVVSLAHVHAIISASSRTEREIQSLMTAGKLQKLKVAGRGNDISGLSEVLITTSDYEELLHASGIAPDIVSDFLEVLRKRTRVSALAAQDLCHDHVTSLTRSGFLVSSSLSGSRNLSLSGSSMVGMPTISRAASGTFAAVGGGDAFEQLGGVGSAKRTQSEPRINTATGELTLSVPNIGPYLRLLDAGRNHIMELLRKSKHKQAPLYLLRERWDGAVDSDSSVSTAKRLRGEFSSILPAKTKKWRVLNGLSFEWALEECLGAGWIELFETHSVGLGVRALT